jgi:hypothetical protein
MEAGRFAKTIHQAFSFKQSHICITRILQNTQIMQQRLRLLRQHLLDGNDRNPPH